MHGTNDGRVVRRLGAARRAPSVTLLRRSLAHARRNQALWDQLALREGKVERQGWLTYYDTAKPRGERRFFILRGVNLTCFESALMEDSGVRVACLQNARVAYTDARAICLAGDWYSIRAGFTWEREGEVLHFECEDEADAQAWVARASAQGAAQGVAPDAAQAPDGAAPEPHQGLPQDAERGRPPPPAYPHESEYGGGLAYVSAPYNGGKSLFEPEVCPALPARARRCGAVSCARGLPGAGARQRVRETERAGASMLC